MQKSGGYSSRGLSRIILAILMVGIPICASAQKFMFETIFERELSIGVTEEIRKKARESQLVTQDKTRVRLKPDRFAEYKQPPEACGISIGRLYKRALIDEFSVMALGTCSVSQRTVYCLSNYIIPDDKVYLSLEYSYVPDKSMSIELLVLGRSSTGKSILKTLSSDYMEKFSNVWKVLENGALCGAEG